MERCVVCNKSLLGNKYLNHKCSKRAEKLFERELWQMSAQEKNSYEFDREEYNAFLELVQYEKFTRRFA